MVYEVLFMGAERKGEMKIGKRGFGVVEEQNMQSVLLILQNTKNSTTF